MDLLSYLDLGPVAEVHVYQGSQRLVGFYSDLELLEQVLQANPSAFLGLQPRPEHLLVRSPNKLSATAQPAAESDIQTFQNTLVHFYSDQVDDARGVDAALLFQEKAATPPLAVSWTGEHGGVIIPVSPITVEDQVGLQAQLATYGRKVSEVYHTYCDHIAVKPVLNELIPIQDLKIVKKAQRRANPKLGAFLQPEIPAKVREWLSHPNAHITKLWESRVRLGVDPHGNELEKTPEAYDAAFLRAAVSKSKGSLTLDELIGALWNRPNNSFKGKPLGIDEARKLCEQVLNENLVDQVSAAPPTAPLYEEPESYETSPNTTLRDRLAGDYFVWSDTAGRYVSRADVEAETKALKVVNFILQNGGELYHFNSTNETVFVLDRIQYVVDSRDPAYAKWFLTNVKFFTADSGKGKELTSAVGLCIRSHPECRISERSRWGEFARKQEVLYYCLDPHHISMIKVSPQGLEEVENGHEGFTLRAPIGRKRKFKLHSDFEKGINMFKELIHQGQALSELERLFSTAFNLVMMIPDHQQRPVKFHKGDAGSGKSFAAFDFERVFYGEKYSSEYQDKPSLLAALKAAGPIVTLDNAETKDRRKFEQVIRVAATGASHTARKLYTTDTQIVYEPNGTLVLTAIEGMTQEEDLSRTFEFNFDKSFHLRNRLNPTSRAQTIEENSDLMLSSLLTILSTKVLPDWEKRFNDAIDFVDHEVPRTEKHRFNDFMAWILIMTECYGEYLWDEERGGQPFNARSLFRAWVTSLADLDAEASVMADPILTCLNTYRRDGTLRIVNSTGYSQTSSQIHESIEFTWHPTGRVVVGPTSANQLWTALCNVAKHNGLPRPHENARIFGTRLDGLDRKNVLRDGGWTRTKHEGFGHGKVRQYTLTWLPPGYIQPAHEDDFI